MYDVILYAISKFLSFSAAYISLDTVRLKSSGKVSFAMIPEDSLLETMFMAPEQLQEGISDEKVTSSRTT